MKLSGSLIPPEAGIRLDFYPDDRNIPAGTAGSRESFRTGDKKSINEKSMINSQQSKIKNEK
jgi:hypothetical protein